MSKKIFDESNIRAIGEAIREKNGSSNTYTTAQMSDAIRNIHPQSVLEPLLVRENGIYTPDANVDGFSQVSVDVQGQSSDLKQPEYKNIVLHSAYYFENATSYSVDVYTSYAIGGKADLYAIIYCDDDCQISFQDGYAFNLIETVSLETTRVIKIYKCRISNEQFGPNALVKVTATYSAASADNKRPFIVAVVALPQSCELRHTGNNIAPTERRPAGTSYETKYATYTIPPTTKWQLVVLNDRWTNTGYSHTFGHDSDEAVIIYSPGTGESRSNSASIISPSRSVRSISNIGLINCPMSTYSSTYVTSKDRLDAYIIAPHNHEITCHKPIGSGDEDQYTRNKLNLFDIIVND